MIKLNSLQPKEFHRFVEFVQSPFYNKHEGVRALMRLFMNHSEAMSSPYPSYEWYADQLYGGDVGETKKKLGPIMTYTSQLLDQFMVQLELESENYWQQRLSLTAFRKRNLVQAYEKGITNLQEEWAQSRYKDTSFYQVNYELASEADRYYEQLNKRSKDDNLMTKQVFMDRYYWCEKLKDACELITRGKILNIQYQDPLFEEMFPILKQYEAHFATDPSILVYLNLYELLKTNDAHKYDRMYEVFDREQSKLPRATLKSIYNYLQNFCIQQINKGNEPFLGAIFKLYQMQLEKRLLIEDGYLSEWHYKNIVTTGLRLAEKEWVRGFIDDYRDELQPEARNNAYTFNLAAYYYETEQYTEVLSLLGDVTYSDLRYVLGSKALLLRTYFDLGENESLNHLVDSFRMYLLRNKLMADVRRAGYYNLFQMTKKLANLRERLTYWGQEKWSKQFEKLAAQIYNGDRIFNKSWLLSRVDRLAKMSSGEKKS